MIPVIIESYPENNTAEVKLNQALKVKFAGAIGDASVNESNIKLQNVTQNTMVSLTFSLNQAKDEITITPEDNANGNMLLGLTDYKLTVAGISSDLGELMTGRFILRFKTAADDPEEVLEEETTDAFALLSAFPKVSGYGITPTSVKLKFNKSVDLESLTDESFIVTLDEISALDDIDMIEVLPVEGEYSLDEDNDHIAVFEPDSPLSDNTTYYVILKDITHTLSGEGDSEDTIETIASQLYSFQTEITPLYVTAKEIKERYIPLNGFWNSLTDLDILRYIKDNSDLAYWISQEASNESNITWDPPERAVKEYVITKTRYDLIYNTYLKLTSDATTKTLGDLTVTYGVTADGILALTRSLKADYEYWENKLKGNTAGRPGPTSFQKGLSVDADPAYMNRQFKDWTGSKSW